MMAYFSSGLKEKYSDGFWMSVMLSIIISGCTVCVISDNHRAIEYKKIQAETERLEKQQEMELEKAKIKEKK